MLFLEWKSFKFEENFKSISLTVKAWCRTGDTPISETIMIMLYNVIWLEYNVSTLWNTGVVNWVIVDSNNSTDHQNLKAVFLLCAGQTVDQMVEWVAKVDAIPPTIRWCNGIHVMDMRVFVSEFVYQISVRLAKLPPIKCIELTESYTFLSHVSIYVIVACKSFSWYFIIRITI